MTELKTLNRKIYIYLYINLNMKALFLIDSSALKEMFEGKKSGDKIVKKFNDIKYSGKEIKVVTTMSSFLRAIYLANSKVQIKRIQKTLNFLEIIPSNTDFKNEKSVRNEIMLVAKVFSKKSKR